MENSNLLPILNPDGDGVHIKNTVLSLDAIKSSQTTFLSSVSLGSLRCRSAVITSEAHFSLLKCLSPKIKALSCQFFRPFALGAVTLELLPSLESEFSCLLFLKNNKQSLLYFPDPPFDYPSKKQWEELRKSNTLLIRANQPLFEGSKEDVYRGLETFLKLLASNEERAFVFCSSVFTLQKTLSVLDELETPYFLDAKLRKIVSLLQKKNTVKKYLFLTDHEDKAKICFLRGGKKSLKTSCQASSFFIFDYFSLPKKRMELIEEKRKYTIFCPDSKAKIEKIIKTVNPKTVFFIGPYAAQYSKEIKASSSKKILHERHLPFLL